jgi:hypothetical protein
MADHARKRIRAAICDWLDGDAELQNRVHKTRLHRFEQDVLPQLAVYASNEESAPDGTGQGLVRMLDIMIEVVLAANDLIDDAADAMATVIEQRMEAGGDFALGLSDCVLASSKLSIAPEQGEQKQASLVLTYRATWFGPRGSPQTINP